MKRHQQGKTNEGERWKEEEKVSMARPSTRQRCLFLSRVGEICHQGCPHLLAWRQFCW